MADRPLSPGERRALLCVIVSISVVGVQIGLFAPLLSLVLAAKGTDSALIGINAAFGVLAIALGAPLVPRLIARFGMVRFVLACVIANVLTVFALKLFDNVYAWFPIRFLFNASSVGIFVASEAWIGSLAQERSRGRVIGLYAAGLGAGFATGPLVLAAVGSQGWQPFLIGAAIVALGAVPLIGAWREAPRLTAKAGFKVLEFLSLAPTLSAAALLYGILETGSYSLMPLYGLALGQSEALSASAVSAFALGAIVLQVPLGALSDRMNRYLVLAMCGLVALLGAAALPLASNLTLAYFVLLFVWGGVSGVLYTLALTIVGERFRDADLVSANAALAMLYGVGSVVGPGLGGIAMDIWMPHGLAMLFAAGSAVFLGVFLVRRSWRRAPQAAVQKP